jgi:ABC-type glycerol-3-phosphate transport system substrate-binding protein
LTSRKNHIIVIYRNDYYKNIVVFSIEKSILMEDAMKRTFVILLMLCILASRVFAGGASAPSGKAAPVFWNGFTGTDRPTVEALTEEFNRTRTDIQVKMEIMPWDSFWQKLMPALIAGNGPDFVAMDMGRIPEFAQANRLQALDEYLARSTVLKRDIIPPSVVQNSTYQNVLYGIPMAFHTVALYYNKKMFREAGLDPEKPPATMAELRNAWSKLIKKDANGQVIQYAQSMGIRSTIENIPVFMWLYGADYVVNGRSALNSPQALEAMTMLAAAFKEGVSPVGLSGQQADDLFLAGKAAMEICGPWLIPGILDAGIEMGIMEIPAGSAGRKTAGGATVFCVNKDAAAKDASWAFIEYWNTVDSQKKWALGVGFPPNRTDMINDPALIAGNPNIRYFLNGMSYSKMHLKDTPKSSRIDEEILVPLYENVFRGTVTPRAGLEEAHNKLNALLAE